MKYLQSVLDSILIKIGANKAVLAKCRRRAKKFRVRAEHNHEAEVQALKEGKQLKATRCKRRAERSHDKAVYWKGRIKKQLNRIHHLEKEVGQLKIEIEKYKKEHGVTVEDNKVVGGTERQRLKTAIHTAAYNYRAGKQPGYYSQGGLYPAYDHTIVHMPYGHRFDCSSFADGIYYCCGLPDPSGGNYHNGGYTGTEGEHGTKISANLAQTGDLVLYGAFPHHHVEVVDDPDKKTTIGHGSPPIDAGVFDLFGDGDYIIRSYVK